MRVREYQKGCCVRRIFARNPRVSKIVLVEPCRSAPSTRSIWAAIALALPPVALVAAASGENSGMASSRLSALHCRVQPLRVLPFWVSSLPFIEGRGPLALSLLQLLGMLRKVGSYFFRNKEGFGRQTEPFGGFKNLSTFSMTCGVPATSGMPRPITVLISIN